VPAGSDCSTFWPTGDEAAELQEVLAFRQPFIPKKTEYAFQDD